MNIKDLAPDSYKVVSQPASEGMMNVKSLAPGSFKVISGQEAPAQAAVPDPLNPSPIVTADATFNQPQTAEQRKSRRDEVATDAAAAKAESDKANSFGGFMGNFGKAVVENIAPSETGLGKTIGKVFGNNASRYGKLINDTSEIQTNLLKHIREQDDLGKDTTKLKALYNDGVKNIKEYAQLLAEEQKLPSWKEALGQLGGTALDLLTAGTYGKAAATMRSGELAVKGALPSLVNEAKNVAKNPLKTIFSKEGAKIAAEGAGIGYGYDVTQGLQNGKENPLTPGLGTVIGAAIPLASRFEGGVRNTLNKGKAIDGLEQTYENLMSGTTAGKKKLDKLGSKTEALNNAGTEGRTPARTLAESGVIPERKGPKLDTYDQAASFRETTKPLREANRQALAEVGLSTQPVPLADLEAEAVANVRTTKNIDAGIADGLEKQVRGEFAKLKNTYGDAIPLSKIDDIKSARWDEVFKNKSLVDADKLKKDSDYAIAKAMQKSIENVAKGAGHEEVAQLNREIGDRLEAAKFLEDLNGKTVKGGRLLKYVTTLVGSEVAGNSIPEKIIGAIGGNIVGNLIISASVASPIKRFLLRNLEARDPAAYTKTIEWLRKQNLDRETRLLLPAPGQSLAPKGKTGSAIPSVIAPAAPTTFETPAAQIRNESEKIQAPVKLPVQSKGKAETTIEANKGKGNYYGQSLGDIQLGPKPAKKVDPAIPVIKTKDLTPPKVQSKSPTKQQTSNAISTSNTGDIISKKPAQDIPKKPKNEGKVSLGTLLGGAAASTAVAGSTIPVSKFTVKNPAFEPAQLKPTEFSIPDRNAKVTEDDLSEAEKILFSELSNVGSEAQRMDEARKILNTAINRMTQLKGKSLKDVLTTGEYQGLGTKQYKLASSTSLDEPSKAKLELIRSVLDEVRQGKLKDNAQGSVFYKHDKTGKLSLGGKRLFK